MARERILVIEDERELADIIRDFLLVEGYEVEVCRDGSGAVAAAARLAPQLVILDLMLPGADGMEVCRQLRERSPVPIVILSARAAESDKIVGLGLGADDYMVKPFSPGEMVARVKAHLRRGRGMTDAAAATGALRFRGLEIDVDRRAVRAHGKEVGLTAREFDLLVFLAGHPRRVFTREQLFDRVWGADRFGDVSTVTVHVRRLREKIERDPATPTLLLTVWGVGYRFDGEPA